MDAQLVRSTFSKIISGLPPFSSSGPIPAVSGQTDRLILALSLTLLLSGCQGKSLVGDNPVFSVLPPRRALVNTATREVESERGDGELQLVSASSEPLHGNTVVAEVNGRPLFVDDLIGSIRLTLEADDRLPESRRREIMLAQIKQRLDQRIDEEIVVDAMEASLPEEQRESLRGHLEGEFEKFLAGYTERMISEGKIRSADEMDAFLAQGGLSAGLLRETFFRSQMARGFVQSRTQEYFEGAPDRGELLQYYRDHLDEFTPEERLRWQEIKVSLEEHGGRDAAAERMNQIIGVLNSGEADFEEVAREASDSQSAENNGNRGWLSRGNLRDKQLETALFELPANGVTAVFEDDNYFSIYRVARHEYADPRPFPSVQAEIESTIQQQRMEAASKKVLENLRAAASVRTIFDDSAEL